MKVLRFAVITGVVMMLASYGCKKDEATANEGSATAAASKTAEKNAPESSKSGSSEEAASPTTATKSPTADAPKAEAPKAVVAPAPKMPANVLGYIALTNFDNIFKIAEKQAKKVGVPIPPGASPDLILLQAAGALGLKSTTWFDRTKPLVVFGPSPKESTSALLALPMTDKASVLAALPATAKKDDEGNAASISLMGQTAYLNFVDGYVIASQKANLFAGVSDYVAGITKGLKLDSLMNGTLSVDNARTIFDEEFKAGLAELKGAKAEIVKDLSREIPDVGSLASLEGMVDFGLKIVEAIATESATTNFSVNYSDNGDFAIPLTVTLNPGGKLSKFAARSTTGKDLNFASKAPKDSWLAFGGRLDPKLFAGLTTLGITSMKQTFKMSEEEVTALTKQFNTLLTLQDGSQWIAMYADGKFPMAVLSSSGLTDGKKYKATMDAYMGMLFTKMMSLVKDILPPNLQAIQGQGFTQIVTTLNGITSNMGVTLTASDTMVGDVGVQSLTISVDPATLNKVSGNDEATAYLNLLGTKLQFAMATGPKAISMAMGPNAIASATQVANGTYNGGSNLGKKLTPGTNAFFHIDASRAVNAFKPIVKKVDPTTEIPTIPPGVEFGITAGSTANSLTMEFYGNVESALGVLKDTVAEEKTSAPIKVAPAAQAAPGAAAPVEAGGN